MSVGAERHCIDRVAVDERRADRLAGVDVPQPHRSLFAEGNAVSIRAENHVRLRIGGRVDDGSCRPVSRSHSRTVSSRLVDTSLWPSGLNATLSTQWLWPASGAPIGWPVLGFQSRMVESSPAEARVRPSGL